MIPDQSILEKVHEMAEIAKRFGASNIRFFGEVVNKNPRPNCGVDIIVDMEKSKASEMNIRALEAAFEKLLGRMVGVKIPDMFLPPIYDDIIMQEIVHLDPLLNQSTDHLRDTHIDDIIIEKRLEILVLAKRHRLINIRLAGEIVRKDHDPDCEITILADIERTRHYFDEREVLGLEIRLGNILKRNVNILIPDRMIPPLFDDYLREIVTL